LTSSPWMRGAPQSRLACAIWRTRSRDERAPRGASGAPGPEAPEAERCHRTTWRVLRSTRPRARLGDPEETVRPRRAAAWTCGGPTRASCWRRARFSRTRSAPERNTDRREVRQERTSGCTAAGFSDACRNGTAGRRYQTVAVFAARIFPSRWLRGPSSTPPRR
jgi:hypothetical protein